ncbi:hypothetical protein ACNFH8_12065 [Pseudomonas sp. NY15436]|uniref:hypothetical protein n=1 Tax=Pseudomonas TaxID=286 RepID=UPI0028FE43C0|nr:hypothetical protein [Pseudomonas aeruginosa]MDU0697896.1 hypothetical protein [Pseudomonas aeruginosa]
MVEPYDREKLLQEVWAEPVSQVAPRYQLSDRGLKKLCERLQIPTPGRGHWARVQAGKPVPKPPALKPYTGPARHLHRVTPVHAPEPDLSWEPRLQAIILYEQDPTHQIQVAARLTRPHFLVEGLRVALRQPLRDRRGLPRPSSRALDVNVSEAMQGRALRLMDALIKALELRGYSVRVGDSRTEVDVLGVSMDLQLTEATTRRPYEPTPQERVKQARKEWVYLPDWQYVPTGKFTLQASSGYGGRITDNSRGLVEEQLNRLILAMGRRAVTVLVEREIQERKAAERRREREAALALQAQQEYERRKLREVERDARAWRRAIQLREYLDAFEANAALHGGLTAEQQTYVTWARAKADWLDPLVRAADALLDQRIEVPSEDWWRSFG